MRSLPTEQQIMASWQGHIDEPVVSVCCMTYNHGPYIEDALEGFLIQETEFPFEILIHDDASVDNTADIIREYKSRYPELIRPIYQTENQYSKGIKPFLNFVIPKAKGKYIALCEGDDFWVCPTKLQKQVAFLESHSDYGLVHGGVNILDQQTGKVIKHFNKNNNIKIPQGQIFHELIVPNHFIKTMTVCYRKDLFETCYLNDPEIMSKPWWGIDISIWLTISLHSKIFYIDEVFATYRLLEESASRSKNPLKKHQFHLLIYDIFFYFAKNQDLSVEIQNKIKIKYYKMLFDDSFSLNDKNLSKLALINLKKLNYSFQSKDYLKYLLIKSKMENLIKKIVFFGKNSKEKKNKNLELIRNIEWQSIAPYIPEGSLFLDIGCGAGYSMKKAIMDKRCKSIGIDPKPFLAGVKMDHIVDEGLEIKQGIAEDLPFVDNLFDVVYSSHVLEHVVDYKLTLKEMNRVLKDDGVMILGVPTSTLAWVGLIPGIMFTTHIRIAKFFLSFLRKDKKIKFKHILLPVSHSKPEMTVFYDIKNYKIEKWRKMINAEFFIVEEKKPAFFWFADYKIFFLIEDHPKYSSSVFFICRKK